MKNFVKAGGRSGSPAFNQPRPNGRAAQAANAKVPMRRTQLTHDDPTQRFQAGHQGNGANANLQAVQHQPQRQRPGQGQVQTHQNAWDTDVESIDTTIQGNSFIQVEDSQRAKPMELDQEQDEDDGESENEGGSEGEGEESDEEQEEEVERLPTSDFGIINHLSIQGDDPPTQKQAISRFRKIYELEPTDRYIDGDSYPTTTSGGPDEYSDGFADGEYFPSGNEDRRGAVPPPNPPSVKVESVYHTIEQPLWEIPSVPEARSPVQRSTKVVQAAAVIREQRRAEANNSLHRGDSRPPTPAVPPVSQPQLSRNQASRKTYAAQAPHKSENIRQDVHTHMHVAPHTQYGDEAPSGHKRKQPHHGTLPPSNKHQVSVPQQGRIVPIRQHASPVAAPSSDFEGEPAEDYDQDALFKMGYDELKNESFDHDPRGTSLALPDGLLQKPLVERLQYVQKKFNNDDQAKFFCSLPTDEWEDAGDWFLEQFSSIIRRTKEARQIKRKQAIAFENEIETRHVEVAKKQQQVQGAMDKMKVQGQGLVSKSPRGD